MPEQMVKPDLVCYPFVRPNNRFGFRFGVLLETFEIFHSNIVKYLYRIKLFTNDMLCLLHFEISKQFRTSIQAYTWFPCSLAVVRPLDLVIELKKNENMVLNVK